MYQEEDIREGQNKHLMVFMFSGPSKKSCNLPRYSFSKASCYSIIEFSGFTFFVGDFFGALNNNKDPPTNHERSEIAQ